MMRETRAWALAVPVSLPSTSIALEEPGERSLISLVRARSPLL